MEKESFSVLFCDFRVFRVLTRLLIHPPTLNLMTLGVGTANLLNQLVVITFVAPKNEQIKNYI